MGLNPIWDSDFFRVFVSPRIYVILCCCYFSVCKTCSLCFYHVIETLVSYSLGELEKAVETLACGSCSHTISLSPKLSLVFLELDRNMVCVFYFLNNVCDIF